MGLLGQLAIKTALGFVSLVASRALFEVAHALGWYPEQQLAALLMASPSAFDDGLILWTAVTIIAAILWAVLDHYLYRRGTDAGGIPKVARRTYDRSLRMARAAGAKLEPSHVIIFGLVIALAGAIWLWRTTPSLAALRAEIEKLKQAPSHQAQTELDATRLRLQQVESQIHAKDQEIASLQRQTPVALNAAPPPIPEIIPPNESARANRYIQLQQRIPEATRIAAQFRHVGRQKKRRIAPGSFSSVVTNNALQMSETQVTTDFKRLLETVYGNTKQLPSASVDPSILAMKKVPDEDELGPDPDAEKMRAYRSVHYQYEGLAGQAEFLGKEMQKEADQLAQKIKDTPYGKYLTGPAK